MRGARKERGGGRTNKIASSRSRPRRLFPLFLSLHPHPSIFLIDGTALLYRAHYAFSASGTALTSAAGEDTTIAVGFVNVRQERERDAVPFSSTPAFLSSILSTTQQTLIRLLEVTPPPTHIAVAFDVPGKTFR